MMLRFEWRALVNAARSREGRQAVVGTVIVAACIAVGGLVLGSKLTADEMLPVLADPKHPVLAVVTAGLLLLPVLLVFGFARASCHQQLLAASQVPAWLASPAGDRTLLFTVWLRHVLVAIVVGLLFVGVPMLAIVVRAGLSPLLLLGFGLTSLWLLGLSIAAIMLALLVGTRLASNRWRRVFAIGHVVVSIAVLVALMAGFAQNRGLREWLVESTPELTWIGPAIGWLAAPTTHCAHGSFSWFVVGVPVALALSTAAVMWIANRTYRSSFGAWLTATPIAPVIAASGRWPRTPVASLVRRGLLEAWRARASVVLVSLFCVFAVWRPATSPFEPVATDAAPVLREVFFLLIPWQMIASLLAMLSFLGVIGDEQKQLPLLATAPVSRRDMVRSRIVLLGWPFCLTALVVAVAGVVAGGVGPLAAVAFVAAAVAMIFVLLGSVLVVGTWPAVIAVHSELPLASNVRSVVPVLVLSLVHGALLFVEFQAKKLVCAPPDRATAPIGVAIAFLVGTWVIGSASLWASSRLAERNLQRLLGPQ